MPRRSTPLVNGFFYHVYNHGIDLRNTFKTKREYEHFQLAMWFYQPEIIPFKLSRYLTLPNDLRQNFIQELNRKGKSIKIHAYCLMSNHFHLLIEQVANNGISKYLGNIQNSYTKYINIKHERRGPLFLSSFKCKLINTEEQFLHVSRYIHLNPYTAGIVKDLPQIKSYPYSSGCEYFNNPPLHPITFTEGIKNYFKSDEGHFQFLADQADYQRQLAHISHLIDI